MNIDSTEMKFSPNVKEDSCKVAKFKSEPPEYDSIDEKDYLKEEQNHLKNASIIGSSNLPKNETNISKLPIEKPSKFYWCNKCQKEFKTAQSLRHHTKTHHPMERIQTDSTDRRYICSTCKKVYTRLACFKAHMVKHKKFVSFGCEVCKKNFSTTRGLKTHMLIHEVKRDSYVCDMCSRSFMSKSSLILHIRRHMNVKPYKCQFCEKEFICSALCRVHMRTHTGEKPFECDICKKKFSQRNNMKWHIMSHMDGKKPYECLVCIKRFRTATHLKDHKLSHSGMKPFTCHVCFKSFVTKYTLRAHERIHLDKKSHECETCGKGFSTALKFNIHMRCHTGEKPYECDICKKRFSYRSSMRLHILRNMKDGGHRKCPLCLKRFSATEALKSHMKIHYSDKRSEYEVPGTQYIKPLMPLQSRVPYVCDICSKSFMRKSSFDSHQNRRRKLQNERINLTDAKPYFECGICKLKFCHSRTLAMHEKIQHYGPTVSALSSNEGELAFQQTNFERTPLKTYVKKKKITSTNASNFNSTAIKDEIDLQESSSQKVILKTYQRKKRLREEIKGGDKTSISDQNSVPEVVSIVKTELESGTPDNEDNNLIKNEPEDRLDGKMGRKLESDSNASNFNSTAIKDEINLQESSSQKVILKTYQRKKRLREEIKRGGETSHSDQNSVLEVVSIVKTEPEGEKQDEDDSNFVQEKRGLEKMTKSENTILSSVKEEPRDPLDLSGSEHSILFPLIKEEIEVPLGLNFETEAGDVKLE